MRGVALLVFCVTVAGGVAFAQSAPTTPGRAASAPRQEEAPDEVIVRGRRLGELRDGLEKAREQAYAIFNEINSDDDFDVRCRDEVKYFSHAKQRVCRPKFEDRLQAQAAREYLSGLFWNCGEVSQDCMFSNVGQSAIAAAGGVEGQLPYKQDQMADEILRLANENEQFGQAILDWFEAHQQYEAARKRRNED
jgi:hypothetical protein